MISSIHYLLTWIFLLSFLQKNLKAAEMFSRFQSSEVERAEFEEGNLLLESNRPSSGSSSLGMLDDNEKLGSKMVTRTGLLYSSEKLGVGEDLEPGEHPLERSSTEDANQTNYPRKLVGDTSQFPYRAIGSLGVGCTGTLVSPRHVLTAGHCVYNLKTKKWYSNLNFSPGRNGASYPSGTIAWKNVYAPDGWTKDGDWEYDYAIIELTKPIGDTAGWINFKATSEGTQSKTITIAGYPADKKAGTLWATSCPRGSQGVRKIYYQCETYNGMSGSGVRSLEKGSQVEVIEGVHGYGGSNSNSATRISNAIFTQLTHFIGNPTITPPVSPPGTAEIEGSYQGSIENTNPNSNLPERALLSLSTPEGSSTLAGSLRFYLGDFSSHEYIEIKISEIQYTPASRQLEIKTTEYLLLLKGQLSSTGHFSGTLYSGDLGEVGKFKLDKIAN